MFLFCNNQGLAKMHKTALCRHETTENRGDRIEIISKWALIRGPHAIPGPVLECRTTQGINPAAICLIIYGKDHTVVHESLVNLIASTGSLSWKEPFITFSFNS